MYINITNDLGTIYMDTGIAALMAGSVASKCRGIVGMASRSKKDGLVSLLKPDSMTKGINVDCTDNMLTVDLHIIVEYGVNITSVCREVVNRVRYSLEENAGIKVKNVNVRVEGITVSE